MNTCFCSVLNRTELKVPILLFPLLCLVFILTYCVKLQSQTSINFVGFQNAREHTCTMRRLYTSFNHTTKYTKRCFMLSWGIYTARDILERNLDCAKYINGTVGANIRNMDKNDGKTRSSYCQRFVMLHSFSGRTGNQLFEVASLIGMAYKYDAIPIIHEKLPLLKYFNMPNQIIGDNWKIINNTKCVQLKAGYYYNCSREFDLLGNITIEGYLQSWRYFEDAKDIIRMVFNFKGTREIKAKKYLESISKEGHQRVCIHVRRKDRDNKHMIEVGYNVAEKDFFERARNFYLRKFSKVQFIVVTDHKTWSRNNLKDVDISPFNDVGDDLALMSMCDHAVVTGGTFGWWGGWLTGGTVVYFNGYPRPGSWLDLQTNRDDYYPPYWIGLS